VFIPGFEVALVFLNVEDSGSLTDDRSMLEHPIGLFLDGPNLVIDESLGITEFEDDDGHHPLPLRVQRSEAIDYAQTSDDDDVAGDIGMLFDIAVVFIDFADVHLRDPAKEIAGHEAFDIDDETVFFKVFGRQGSSSFHIKIGRSGR
jgi:hypothetical protein